MFALWFAVRKPAKADGAFWVLPATQEHLLPLDIQEDVFDLNRTYLFRPAHITSRIVAQDGWFTVHWYVEKKDKFIPLESSRVSGRTEEVLHTRQGITPLRNGRASVSQAPCSFRPCEPERGWSRECFQNPPLLTGPAKLTRRPSRETSFAGRRWLPLLHPRCRALQRRKPSNARSSSSRLLKSQASFLGRFKRPIVRASRSWSPTVGGSE
jgi:hypothetical protein